MARYCPHCGSTLDTIEQPRYKRGAKGLVQDGYLVLHTCWNEDCPYNNQTVSDRELAKYAEPAYDEWTGEHRPAWSRPSFFSLRPDKGD